MAKTEYFKENIFKFGQVGPKDVINFEFEFDGDKKDIEYIDKGCGCTDAYFEDGKIKGTLNLAQAASYSEGLNPVNKYVIVYMNDGEPHYVRDEMLRRKINQDKHTERLQIAGMVLKESE